jgi:hypothetical protein
MLENFISAAEGTCDEDDDCDHNDDDFDVAYLRSVLMAGKWVIRGFGGYYGNDEYYIFRDYTFDFLENGVVEAISEYETFYGSYYVYGDYGVPRLDLGFSTYPLYLLADEWSMCSFGPCDTESEFSISASYVSCSNIPNGLVHLGFGRPNMYGEFYLDKILGAGKWVVSSYTISGMDETVNFEGLLFDFEAGTYEARPWNVVASKGDETVDGTWSPLCSYGGCSPLILDFGDSAPLNALNNEWEIIGARTKKVELFHFNEEDGTSKELIFEPNDL